jgi:gamma-glutamyltranspeptidase/glutathione hydrolase
MDLHFSSYPTLARKPVLAPNGVVATSQPLAAQAGLNILRKGGNAVDAAIATAITLTVIEPTSNHVGSDMFALVWDGDRLHGLNGSGRAPAAHTLERLRQAGYTSQMPDRGWLSVTIPGAPGGWHDLHARFGKLPFATLFEDAIHYAESGFPVGISTLFRWRGAIEAVYPSLSGDEFAPFGQIFAPGGRAPREGERFRNPDQARTLQAIAESGSEAFYHGALAEQIVAFAARTGGHITLADLAAHHSTWVDPISTNYRGYDVWEIPPNGQGISALIALNILEGFDIAALPYTSPERYHVQIEALKLAAADAERYVADPEHAHVPIEGLLSKVYAAGRRAMIGASALHPAPGTPPGSDTVYLCAADSDGMMVSLIQSNYAGFGSYIAIPGLGIALQNRGSGFRLDAAHPNVIAPGKRPFHTIIPGFLTKDGHAVGPFGVMGGSMQPQGHVQMVVNTVDYGMNPQASLDAPRWYWRQGLHVNLEPQAPAGMVEALQSRGHDIRIEPEIDIFGRGQIIWRVGDGPDRVYVAGSESRADGQAAGY